MNRQDFNISRLEQLSGPDQWALVQTVQARSIGPLELARAVALEAQCMIQLKAFRQSVGEAAEAPISRIAEQVIRNGVALRSVAGSFHRLNVLLASERFAAKLEGLRQRVHALENERAARMAQGAKLVDPQMQLLNGAARNSRAELEIMEKPMLKALREVQEAERQMAGGVQ